MLEVITYNYGDDVKYKVGVVFSTFPAGEAYVRIENISSLKTHVLVKVLSADANTIMKACLVADAVKQYHRDNIVIADFGYFPYGRQDRVCKEGESFSLKFFTEMLNLRFDEVRTFDVHSNVTRELLDYRLKENKDFLHSSYINTKGHQAPLKTMLPNDEDTVVVSPDNGAIERSKTILCYLELFDLVCCDKVRQDNKITVSISDNDKKLIADKKSFIISDDICDGGGTFIVLAQSIKEINPNAELYLVISHGVFSKGFDVLTPYYKEILMVDNDYNNFQNQ